MDLRYVVTQTKEICLEAIKSNGCAIQYVEHQTEELCIEAIKSSKYAIVYVDIKKFPDVYTYYKLLWS